METKSETAKRTTTTPNSIGLKKRKLPDFNGPEDNAQSKLKKTENFQNFEKRVSIFIPLNSYLKPIATDGNCLFRAVSHQLYGHENRKDYLRKMSCLYIEKHVADFYDAAVGLMAEFEDLLPDEPTTTTQEHNIQFIHNYGLFYLNFFFNFFLIKFFFKFFLVEAAKADRFWVGEEFLNVLPNIIKHNIAVYRENVPRDKPAIYKPKEASNDKTKEIRLFYNSKHYWSIVERVFQ